MDAVEALYDEHARERIVPEAPKRVDAPERLPFERDRARVVHAASFRRLAAKTQVLGPYSDDFVRNRLTHSLEVAQIARDLSRALGSHPDIAETAALAHDLGHPPFGHNGERVLHELAAACGGFEGNAQTLRLLTRLESKTSYDDGRSAGLNLTRATLDACTKYPWRLGEGPDPASPKFGAYADDVPAFAWAREGAPERERCVEAQIMDLADDVAYSVHDVEDGIVAGKVRLLGLDEDAVQETARSWFGGAAEPAALTAALERLRSMGSWPTSPYDRSRGSHAALKNLTSDLIGRFCGAVQQATFAQGAGPFVRYATGLVVPDETWAEITLLKSVAAHYVMQDSDRIAAQSRQRELVAELVAAIAERGVDALAEAFRADWSAASGDADRLRVVIDQVASLTDASAVEWHRRLCG
ncbi:MAG: deoxyguanosinetriphosphate triphosphohydrolase [Nocardioidaceae bacterium]|nr:deoxyguanosinetriphosphate triphosphohydrolase [Nocardioidaceae bacterium]MCL2611921.1 deoxyguanosinetriphosphate triphosphohydrolase [Nocardioidaceae bacterium]